MVNKDSIVKAVNEILRDQSYSESVSRMKKMIGMNPFPAEKKLVKWTEFLGEFQNLDNLKPVGAELDFITFYNIDVYFFFVTVVISTLALVYLGIRAIVRKIVRFYRLKSKKE